MLNLKCKYEVYEEFGDDDWSTGTIITINDGYCYIKLDDGSIKMVSVSKVIIED